MTQQHSAYLNALRDSGKINMFGAGPYVQKKFGLSSSEARQIVMEWMLSFSKFEESKR